MAEFIVRCPECKGLVAAEQINISKMIAACKRCNKVFSFDDQVPKNPHEITKSTSPQIPSRFVVETPEDGNSLNVMWKWNDTSHYGLVVFCVLWDLGIVFFCVLLLLSSLGLMPNEGGEGIGFGYLVIVPHILIGVGMSWFCLAMSLNTSRLFSDGMRVISLHGPIRWRANQDLMVTELRGFRCVLTGGEDEKSRLVAVDITGKHHALTGQIESGEARYLASLFSRFCGMQTD